MQIFATFNCVTFDDEFNGSDRWLRVDLTIDCNSPDRNGWLAYASMMIALYPVGVPLFFAYLLLVHFRATLEEQRDDEACYTLRNMPAMLPRLLSHVSDSFPAATGLPSLSIYMARLYHE